MQSQYEDLLYKEFDYKRFNELCVAAFKYGEFDKIDEILMLAMPLIHIVYYQSIHRYDDDYRSKDDLIQDAILVLYRDMKLTWDKFIHVDNYYEYFKMLIRNTMIAKVSGYNTNFHEVVGLTDEDFKGKNTKTQFDIADIRMIAEDIQNNITNLAGELLSHRFKRNSLLRKMFTDIYSDRVSDEEYERRIRRYYVHGLSTKLASFYKTRVQYFYQLAATYHRDQLKGDEKSLKNLEEVMARIRSDEYEIMSQVYGDTPLPEIYAELGTEATLKLIKVVGGTTVQFPDVRDISDTLLGSLVYQLSDGEGDNLQSVSEVYGLPYNVIKRIFNKHISNLQRRESFKREHSESMP